MVFQLWNPNSEGLVVVTEKGKTVGIYCGAKLNEDEKVFVCFSCGG